jgi:hypothetical protein
LHLPIAFRSAARDCALCARFLPAAMQRAETRTYYEYVVSRPDLSKIRKIFFRSPNPQSSLLFLFPFNQFLL